MNRHHWADLADEVIEAQAQCSEAKERFDRARDDFLSHGLAYGRMLQERARDYDNVLPINRATKCHCSLTRH